MEQNQTKSDHLSAIAASAQNAFNPRTLASHADADSGIIAMVPLFA
jgi:hypothetical protein